MNDNKIRYKLVLFGDTAVGKSCLVTRFVNEKFYEFQEPTIGAAFSSKGIILNDNNIVFEIWDTAGQERYRSLAPMYYRSATVAVIVYDITNRDSFNNISKYIESVKKEKDNAIIILVGNKTDLNDVRKVDTEEGKKKAEENNIIWFGETSACDNDNNNNNIDNLFKFIVTSVEGRLTKENINISLDNNIICTV